MLVMRKLDRELSLIFRFAGLVGSIRVAENEPPVFAWRRAHMADRANSRTCADEGLAREKLLSMATNAGVMIWKVGNVWKVAFRRPLSWDLVAGVTSQGFMFVG